jgi:DNA invertase Pin-like site-specific DNA recombinase
MSKILVEVDADKLNAIRRQLSFKLNTDLTNDEALQIILNGNMRRAQTPHYNAGKDAVLQLIKDGSSSGEALRTLGCSRSTFFRIKAKEKRKAEQS